VFNDLKRSLKSNRLISSKWVARVEPEYESVVRSIFRGISAREPYALITSYSDIVDFLKSSKSDLMIGLIFHSYRGRARV
jgi:hypothetical protein